MVEVIASQQKLIASQQKLIQQLQAEAETLQKQMGKNPTERLDEAYSERAEAERQAKATGKRRKRKTPSRSGRFTTAEKIARAARTEQVYPDDCDPKDCKLSHTRVAWRLGNGRAVLVAYDIYRQGNKYGQPTGVPGRGEFGMEILIALAYQVYTLGLSLDKACQVLGFFQGLSITKSQANALLNQLARVWEAEFDTLCTLLANSAVVHCDETGWSINSVWAFLTETLTVMFYGVHKDGETLQQILDKATFSGVLISDDAAVYQGFSKSQKCWAHLLRKAIKLTLQAPDNTTYREFADSLLAIYRSAKRVAKDQRYSAAGRQNRVGELDDELLVLCSPRWFDEEPDSNGVTGDYRRLVNEIMRLMLTQELFVFVTTAGVDGNNNASERELRDDALRRKTGRTNKTPRGAKRQTIITSVLRTLGKQLSKFTLASVITEVQRWVDCGRSCFTDQAAAAGLSRPPPDADQPSLLDRIILTVDVQPNT
ncbi:MAG: transposase [Rhodopirellula sp.]|nr:transposase [Rhodopirellula sp.]